MRRPAQYRYVGEADEVNMRSLIAQHSLYYLSVAKNEFDLFALMDTDAMHSFVSL